MATASILGPSAVAFARGEVGYTETPRNITKYWRDLRPGLQGAPWCGAFATAAWKAAGFDLRPHVNPYSASALRSWARSIGAYKTTRARTGDIVLYGFGDSKLEHIGLAWPDEGSRGYRAIEGNTSPGASGSQSNGGGVYIRYRGRRSIDGWVDMATVLAHYGVQAAATVAEAIVDAATGALDVDGIAGRATIKEIQRRLGVQVDGIMGPDTVRALQRFLGTTVDGIVSGQNKTTRGAWPNARGDVWKIGKGGSNLGRALQAYTDLALTRDGLPGPDTVRGIQSMLNKYPAFLADADKGIVAQRKQAAGL